MEVLINKTKNVRIRKCKTLDKFYSLQFLSITWSVSSFGKGICWACESSSEQCHHGLANQGRETLSKPNGARDFPYQSCAMCTKAGFKINCATRLLCKLNFKLEKT